MSTELPSESSDGDVKLLERLNTALLRQLVERVESGKATASELATAAAVLGKGGMLAKTGAAGGKTVGAAAWDAAIRALTPAQIAEAAAEAGKKEPIPAWRGRPARREERGDAEPIRNAS